MSEPKLIWRERTSKSEFVATVWTCRVSTVTSRTVLADPCTAITLVKEGGSMRVLLRGPVTKPYNQLLGADYMRISIRLRPGVIIRGFSAQKFVNSTLTLPIDDETRFWLEDINLQFPDFDNAELLIDQLYNRGYLRYETPGTKALSVRSYSRLIKHTTGLSPYRLHQLQRAHQALRLLKQGMPATAVAAELDFVDESHLTRVVKQFLGHTPRQLLYLPQIP